MIKKRVNYVFRPSSIMRFCF